MKVVIAFPGGGGDRSLAGVGVGNDELDTFLKFLSKAYIYSYKFVH